VAKIKIPRDGFIEGVNDLGLGNEAKVVDEIIEKSKEANIKDEQQELGKSLRNKLNSFSNMNTPKAWVYHMADEFMSEVRVFNDVVYARHEDDGVYKYNPLCIGQKFKKKHPLLDETDINKIISEIKYRTYPSPELPIELDYINFKNVRYHIDTKKYQKYKNDDLIFHKLNANYNEKTPTNNQLVDDFISNLVGGGEDEIKMIWEMIGYCLIPGNRMQKSHIMLGHAGTGKSVLLKLLEAIVGKENTMAVSLDALTDSTVLASIFGKQLCVIDEADNKKVQDISGFKTITSEGSIQAKFLYQEPFMFRYTGKLVMSGNDMPKIFDSGEAVNRRMIIIPCSTSPLQVKKDYDLERKLLEHIEYFVLRGLQAYHEVVERNDFFRSQRSLEYSHQGKLETVPCLEFIEALSCRRLDGTKTSTVYENYVLWNEKKGNAAVSKKVFDGHMRSIFEYKTKQIREDGERVYIFTDIKRINGYDDNEDTDDNYEQMGLPF
jgi:P4 family phage/plasmid primase-like protien